jgi:type I restriction enzyme S subunit
MKDRYPDHWEAVRLQDIAEIILGGTPSTLNEDYWTPAEIDWVTAKDISTCDDAKIQKTERRISILGLEKSNARLLPAQWERSGCWQDKWLSTKLVMELLLEAA